MCRTETDQKAEADQGAAPVVGKRIEPGPYTPERIMEAWEDGKRVSLRGGSPVAWLAYEPEGPMPLYVRRKACLLYTSPSPRD